MVHTRMRYRKLIQNENELINWWEDTPFLNGGLFECLDYEIKESNSTRRRFDSFSDNPINENQLRFPNLLFWSPETKTDLSAFFGEDSQKSKKENKHANVSVRGIFNILNRYKFTIEENTPLEQEIALDPELLGRIFENLLASYNPETEETARKSTGSFYTPREIVEYMVDESLIAYLQQNVTAISDENTFRLLLTDSEEKPNLSPKQCLQIIDAVEKLKIIDPACGSGAFPMGILHKLVLILRKADPQNLNWKQAQINALESISDDDLKFQLLSDIEKAFDAQHNYGDYGRKLYLIQNCVFGVDKQAIAVQISKLRFFISLLVDQKVVPHEKNFGLRPLPNLETKFVAADSLIGIHKGGQADFSTPKVIELKKELSKARKDYFTIRNRDQKNKNRDHQADLRKNIIQEISRTGFDSELTLKLAEWNPFDQNASASFFDPEWMFGINTGFDIVIGNPPYVQIQKFSGKKEQTDWLNQKYQTYNRMGDIYCLFYEKGWQILRQKGILAFITSNKWMRAGYGESIRNFFATQTNPLLLIDFGGLQVFESATVDTNILIFRREENRNQTRACTFAKDFDLTTGLTAYVKAKAYTKAGFTAESWIIGTETQDRIKQKIEAKGTPLKDWEIQIYRGITTGLNEAFIIDTATKDRLCAEDPRSAEILKPILRGKDIKKWKAEWAGLWVIATFPAKNINIDDYPAVKNFLLAFGKERLEQSGKSGSRKKTGNQWFETQDQIRYWQEFEKPKIIYGEIMTDNEAEGYPFPRFVYADDLVYGEATSFILTGLGKEELKYLTAVLNSKIGRLIVKEYSIQLQERQFRVKKICAVNYPIPKIKNISLFTSLVDHILSLKQTNPDADISALEAEVDARVFRLYELTAEEVEVVLAASPASEDQKERIRENYHRL